MKNKYVTAVLAIVLGTFGVHKFYLGKTLQGIIYLVFCWTGITFFIGVIEGIYYLLRSKESFDREYNNKTDAYPDALYKLLGVNGQLYVYENRIIIERKGILAFSTQAFAGSKTLPFKAIQTIQFKEGSSVTNGYIQFGVMGNVTTKGGLMSATDDGNAVFFKKSDNQTAQEIRNYIEGKIY